MKVNVVEAQGNEDKAESEGQAYIDWLGAYVEYNEEAKEANEGEDKQASKIAVNISEDGHDDEPSSRSIARIFMKGMLGDEETLPYRDQVDVVADFAEQQPTSTEFEKAVALLDDRNSVGTHPLRCRSGRPNWGPYTPKELREELSKQVNHLSIP